MNNPARVLIVDDEPNIRLMFRTACESAGWQTSEAASGEEALTRLDKEGADIVLLDLRMPGVDGFEVLSQLRERNDETPVVMITAHGSIPDAVAAMKLGAIDFISKPVKPDVLRRVVSEVLARHAVLHSEAMPQQPREEPFPLAHSPASHGKVAVTIASPVLDLAPVKLALNPKFQSHF